MPVTIYQHVVAHLPREGPGLSEGGDVLPDDPQPADQEGVVRLAPGLADHILDPGSELAGEQAAAAVVRDFVGMTHGRAPSETYERFYRRLVDIEELGFLEPFVRRVFGSPVKKRDVRRIALRLVTESTDRLPVKTGIALLGICARREDQRLLLTMARHAEFTGYAGMAIANAFGEQESVLWELAKVVVGWGRVDLVYQLASTRDPRIKAWILRQANEDFTVLSSACLVLAEAGELRNELERDELDDDVCLAAGAILQQLIEARIFDDGQAIDDYGDGPEAIRLYLSHLSRRPERLEYLQPLMTVLEYLESGCSVARYFPEFREEMAARVADRPMVGWSDQERARATTHARWVLLQPGWRRTISEGLESDDDHTFYLAERAADRLGDDVFPVLLARLQRDPYTSEITWEDAGRAADQEGFDRLLELARARLSEHRPYDGPFFPVWLRPILDGFERFPGKAWWPLIREGLSSPVMMERRFGINGLRYLGRPWPPEALALLVRVCRSDPDEDNQDWAAELLEEHGFPGRVGTP